MEKRPGKYNSRACYCSADEWIRWQLASWSPPQAAFFFLFDLHAQSDFLRTEAKLSRAIEGRDERVWSVCYVHIILNRNGAFARYWPLLFFTEIISIFLCRCPHTYCLAFLSVLDPGLFQILFEIHSNKILGTLSNRRRRTDDGNRKRDISFETSLRMYNRLCPDVALK